MDKKTIRPIILIIFSSILFFFLLLHFAFIWSTVLWVFGIFVPILIGLCAAFVINPLMSTFERLLLLGSKKSPGRRLRAVCRTSAIILAFAVVLGVLLLLMLIIIPEVSATISQLAGNIPQYAKNLTGWINGLPLSQWIPEEFHQEFPSFDWGSAFTFVSDFFTKSAGSMLSGVVGATATLLSGLWNAVFGIIISIYVLAQKEMIGRFFLRLIRAYLPGKYSRHVFYITRLSNQAFSNFVTGQLMEAFIIGTLCYIGMLIFRFPYALTVAAIVAFTALIPVVGAWIGAIFGFLLILTTSPIQALWFLVFLLVLQQLESNIIYPKVIGKTLGLPGILVLLAVWIGGSLSGVVGMLISVPLCSVFYTLLKRQIDKRIQKKSGADLSDSEEESDNSSMDSDDAGA